MGVNSANNYEGTVAVVGREPARGDLQTAWESADAIAAGDPRKSGADRLAWPPAALWRVDQPSAVLTSSSVIEYRPRYARAGLAFPGPRRRSRCSSFHRSLRTLVFDDLFRRSTTHLNSKQWFTTGQSIGVAMAYSLRHTVSFLYKEKAETGKLYDVWIADKCWRLMLLSSH
jgi:hypothetical protein